MMVLYLIVDKQELLDGEQSLFYDPFFRKWTVNYERCFYTEEKKAREEAMLQGRGKVLKFQLTEVD